MDDISLKCKFILDRGLTKEICQDFREIRRYAMCLTWDLMDKKKLPFRDARKLAWEKTKTECAKIGAIV